MRLWIAIQKDNSGGVYAYAYDKKEVAHAKAIIERDKFKDWPVDVLEVEAFRDWPELEDKSPALTTLEAEQECQTVQP